MILTGKTLPAMKAKKIGLIDRIVQPIGAGVKPAEENNYNYLKQVRVSKFFISYLEDVAALFF